MRPELKQFCEKYNMNVLSESKRSAKSRPIRLDSENDGSKIYDQMTNFDSEPLVTIDIPLSKLETLRSFEEILFRNIEDTGRRHMFEAWMTSQNLERELRRKYTSVKIAYENYQAVLAWCTDKRCEFKNLPD